MINLEQRHSKWMSFAFSQAQKAYDSNEVPVGAVVVNEAGQVIGVGHNQKETLHNTLAHAEMAALEEAQKSLGDWRLNGCTLITTLEPCPMCAGAILQTRISRLIIGAVESKWGAAGSVVDLFKPDLFNHKVKVEVIPHQASVTLLQSFFEKLRNKSKEKK